MTADSTTTEKLNGHSNSTASNSGGRAEAQMSSGPDGNKQAFLSLDQGEEKTQAKASVMAVFKKVNTQLYNA